MQSGGARRHGGGLAKFLASIFAPLSNNNFSTSARPHSAPCNKAVLLLFCVQ